MGNKASTGGSLMRAVVREKVILFSDSYPAPRMPKPGSEEVRVRVRSAAINPVDYKAPKMILGKVVGLDFAGVVEAVADGSKHGWKVGEEVYGTTKGSLADLTLVADGGRLAYKPSSLSFIQAASIPTVYLTGLQALRNYGALPENGRVLVIGASGGTGLAGVQLARSLGASLVVGVCSGKNREFVERHGAHRVVDYATERISEIFGDLPEEEKFDIVYDCATGSGAGENYQAEAWKVLKARTGQYVPINGGGMLWARYLISCQNNRTHLFLTNANRADLDTITNLIEAPMSGRRPLEPVVAKTLPFTAENVDEGFAMLKGRRTVGKIVFDMVVGSGS